MIRYAGWMVAGMLALGGCATSDEDAAAEGEPGEGVVEQAPEGEAPDPVLTDEQAQALAAAAAQAEADRIAQEEARIAEEERKAAEEEARLVAEEARLAAEEEARLAAEEKRAAEEEARLAAEEERRIAEEEARMKAEEEAQAKAEEERIRAEEEQARIEEERLRAETEARQRAEQEAAARAEAEKKAAEAKRQAASNVKKTRKQISTIAKAVETFRYDHNKLPEKLADLVKGSYYTDSTRDAWENELVYKVKGNDYTVLSYGSDAKEGGEGYAKDLTNKD